MLRRLKSLMILNETLGGGAFLAVHGRRATGPQLRCPHCVAERSGLASGSVAVFLGLFFIDEPWSPAAFLSWSSQSLLAAFFDVMNLLFFEV